MGALQGRLHNLWYQPTSRGPASGQGRVGVRSPFREGRSTWHRLADAVRFTMSFGGCHVGGVGYGHLDLSTPVFTASEVVIAH